MRGISNGGFSFCFSLCWMLLFHCCGGWLYNCCCAFDLVDYLRFKCMGWFERQNHQNVECGMHYEWACSKRIYTLARTHGDNILPSSTRNITYESCIFCICNELHTPLAHACLLTYSLTIIHTQTNALIVYVFIHLKLSHITYSLSCIAYRSRHLFQHWNRHTTIIFFVLCCVVLSLLLVVVVVLMPFCCLYSESTWANSYRSLNTVSSDTDRPTHGT